MITSKQVEALAQSNRIHFYEVLAHNLTVVVREIWSNEQLTNDEKVDHLREVNEILHRVTAKIWGVRLGGGQYDDETLFKIIDSYASKYQSLKGAVDWVINKSYEVASK